MKAYFESLSPLKPQKTRTESQLGRVKNIKAVLFDVYGTLLISASGDIGSTGLLGRQAYQAMKAVGVPFAPRRTAAKIGNTAIAAYLEAIAKDHFLSKINDESFPEVEIRNIWRHVVNVLHREQLVTKKTGIDYKELAIAFEFSTNPVWPMPNFESTLTGLTDGGYKLGIVSNAQFFTPMLLRWFLNQKNYTTANTIDHFTSDLCVFSYAEGRAKPSRRLYEVLLSDLKRHRLKPENCLYIGNDMLNDVYPAKQLGFKTVLFAGDKRSLRWRNTHPVVNVIQPDRIITDLSEIFELIPANVRS